MTGSNKYKITVQIRDAKGNVLHTSSSISGDAAVSPGSSHHGRAFCFNSGTLTNALDCGAL